MLGLASLFSLVASFVTSLRASGWAFSAAGAAFSAGAAPSSFFSSWNHVSIHVRCGPRQFLKSSLAGMTYTAGGGGTAATGTTTTTTASPAAATSGLTTAGTLGTTLSIGTLALVVRLRLAGELDGHLTLEDLLAGELGDGALGLAGSREVDKGIANRAVGARVLWD